MLPLSGARLLLIGGGKEQDKKHNSVLQLLVGTGVVEPAVRLSPTETSPLSRVNEWQSLALLWSDLLQATWLA
jgi:siroheme synthase (precorrin-2 oxidase/ferrochelatase)